MMNLHGQVINYKQIKKLSTRIDFLEKKEVKKINKIIQNEDSLLFMPAAISEQNLPDLFSEEDETSQHKYLKWYYKLILFGVFPDGRSATVVITNIKPYLYVKIPDKYQKSTGKRYKFKSKFEEIMRIDIDIYKNKGIQYESIEIIQKKYFMGFNNSEYYLHIIFPKAGTFSSPRNRTIKLAVNNHWKTATDDRSGYYKIPIRDNRLTVSSWIKLNKYKTITKNKYFKDKTIYLVNLEDIAICDDNIIQKNPLLSRDKTMVMGWDIECASKSGDLPVPENKDDRLFMICLDFQWYHSKNQILRINLVDHPVSPHPNFLSIVCNTEKNILKAFSYIFGLMTPEYVVGFNDSGFDWPWVVNRIWKHSKKYFDKESIDKSLIEYTAQNMDRLVLKKHGYRYNTFNSWLKKAKKDKEFSWYTGDQLKTDYNAYLSNVIMNYRKEKTKIDADTYQYGYFLQYNGYIAFDVRTIFRQLYPTAEKSSLNHFLALNNLKSKEDMEIQEMFRIYWDMDKFVKNNKKNKNKIIDNEKFEELKDKMKEVANYCIVDSQRCPELIKKRNVIPDRRQVANLSYTSIYDSFHRATGMKIRNMVYPILQDRGYIASNLSQKKTDDDTYPGAMVLNPKTGLYNTKLTLKERVEKHSEFIDEYGDDFNESYSLRDIPHKNLILIKDVGEKIDSLEQAIIQTKSSGNNLSREEATKLVNIAKKIYSNKNKNINFTKNANK